VKAIHTAKTIAAVLCAAVLFGCQGGTPSSGSKGEAKKEGQVLADVNGGSITTGDFNRELKNLPEYLKAMAETPEGRKEMLDTMIIRELILQQATKDGLDKSADIEEKMKDLKKRLIVESFLKKKVETESQVSDADLQKFYEQNKEKFKTGEQIRASHILVKTEAEAKDILAKIKAGGNFEELAKKNSVDSSAAKGGDLGFFTQGSMVGKFEQAAEEFVAATRVENADQGLATMAHLFAGRALDAANKRDLALAQYRVVLSRPDVFESHDEAHKGLRDPFRADDARLNLR